MGSSGRIAWSLGLCLWLGVVGSRSVSAAQIRLEDGTEFSAELLQSDGADVVISLPRASVATIDGAALPPPVAQGEPAPEFSVVDLNGGTQTLGVSDGAATMVHFWASWCPHCRSDVELMKDVYARYDGKGLRMVMVSVDQDRSDLDAFIKKQDLPYPIVGAYSDPQSNASGLPGLYESQGIPAYYLVDAKGVITEIKRGSVTESNYDLDSALQRLIP